MLLSSCSPKKVEVIVPKTEYLVYVPTKIAQPTKPKFYRYDPRYTLEHPENFKKFQQNSVLMKNYTNNLKSTIIYYENQIDMLQKKKEDLQHAVPISSDSRY